MPGQLFLHSQQLHYLSIKEMHDAFTSHRNTFLRSHQIKSFAYSIFCCHTALLKASHFANTPAYHTITEKLNRQLKALDEFVNREPINNTLTNKQLVLEQINYSLKLWHNAFSAATARLITDDTYAEKAARDMCGEISRVTDNIQTALNNRARSNQIAAEPPPQSEIMHRENNTESGGLARRILTLSQ